MENKKKSLGEKLLAYIGSLLRALFNVPIRLKFVLPVLIILVVGSVFYTRQTMIEKVGGKADYAEAMQYIEIKDLAEENYISGVNRTAMGDAAASAMVSNLGDKWSYYMSPDEYKSYQLYYANEYSGIGMSLAKLEGGGFQVVSVSADSPAARAGLSAGMIITSVDGTDVIGSDLDTVRTLIRSKMNASFVLGIGNGKDSVTVDCSGGYASSVTYLLEQTEAGYVQILDFEAGTGDDAIAAIEDLLYQGASSLVLDLRDNPGGIPGEVQKLLDYLLPSGDMFYSVNNSGKKLAYTSDSVCIQVPMCVITNSATYAEAEVCAAVLQELGWATVVGEPTTGMTRTQEVIELTNGAAMRLSTRSYLTANGTDICDKGGVVPDMIVYNTVTGAEQEDQNDTNFKYDEQLTAALKYLS